MGAHGTPCLGPQSGLDIGSPLMIPGVASSPTLLHMETLFARDLALRALLGMATGRAFFPGDREASDRLGRDTPDARCARRAERCAFMWS
jgi:hypothetical protein